MAMMDVDEAPSRAPEQAHMALHRVRFVDWAPSAVTSIAFLPVQASSSRSLMAVGHENGNIDLCVWVQDDDLPSSSLRKSETTTPVLPKGWLVDTTLVGAIPSKIDTLAFVLTASDTLSVLPRLFSTSGGSIVTEHFLPPHLLQTLRDGGHTTYSSLAAQSLSMQASKLAGTTRTISSQGGSIWCMAASPMGRYLAIGCEDGHVRIVDVQDGRFELLAGSKSARRMGDGSIGGVVGTLDRAKTRVVSLAWGPPRRRAGVARSSELDGRSDSDSEDEDNDDWEESFILGGTTHSSALIWSLSTGRVENKLLVDKSRNEQTIVWSVALLSDGTLILGDSLGHVSFFDAKSRTLISGGRFANHGKGADVLTICVGPDEKSVYSAGLDQKVVEYALVEQGQQAKWISTASRRLHAHDIRALAIDPPAQLHRRPGGGIDRVPILVSGGSDFNLVFTPSSPPSQLARLAVSNKKKAVKGSAMRQAIARFDDVNPISTSPLTTFADTIQRRVSFVPPTGRGSALGGGGVVRICPSQKWLLLRREKSLGIWQLPETGGEAVANDDVAPSWTKVLEMQVKLRSNIVCAEISNDARYIAVSDVYETKLYEMELVGQEVVPRKVKSFAHAFAGKGLQACPGSSAIAFSPESSRIILASYPGSFLHVVELPRRNGEGGCKVVKSFDDHRKRSVGRAVAGRKDPSRPSSNGHSGNGATNGIRNSDTSDYSDDGDDGEKAEAKGDRNAYTRIDLLHISPDGQYLVSIDSSKRINSYSLDTLHYYRPLPSPSQLPTSVAFDLSNPSRLCLVLPTNQIIVYDLEERHQEARSSQDIAMERAVMEKIVTIRESAIGATWLTSSQLLLWGSTWICVAKRMPADAGTAVKATKRSRGQGEGEATGEDQQRQWNVSLTFKYQPLLHVGLLPASSRRGVQDDADELVVVERPYYDIARSLPPTWFSGATYGS